MLVVKGIQNNPSEKYENHNNNISVLNKEKLYEKITEWQNYKYNQEKRYDCSGFVWDVLYGDRKKGNSSTLIDMFSVTEYNPDIFQLVYFKHTRTYSDGATDMAHVGILKDGKFIHFQNYPSSFMTIEDFHRRRSA